MIGSVCNTSYLICCVLAAVLGIDLAVKSYAAAGFLAATIVVVIGHEIVLAIRDLKR